MPAMPAFCDTCGTVFASGFWVENCRNTSFSGCSSGPCPNCGGTGHIPDGVYDVTANVIKLISGTAKSFHQLKQLADILRTAQKENLSKDEVVKRIDEEVPELTSLSSILPKTRNELYAFLTLILTAIGLLITAYSTATNTSLSEDEIQSMIENTIERSIVQPIPHISQEPQLRPQQRFDRKIGRNELCPCGSGKKYKKCCMQLL